MSLILVTGAAGQVGSVLCQNLREAAINFRATDCRSALVPNASFSRANLLNLHACRKLLKGVGTLVHLANHPTDNLPVQKAFDENVLMNRLLFQAACEAGVPKIIFASSLQVVSSEMPEGIASALPAYLPLDEKSHARPDNFYALGKMCSESMLAQLSQQHGLSAIALRLPVLCYRSTYPESKRGPFLHCPGQAFSYLTYGDTADLIRRLIEVDLPGYRVYLPASRRNVLGVPSSDLIRTHYSGVPQRGSFPPEGGLVDISSLERETGWIPRELSLPEPASLPPSFRKRIEPWLSFGRKLYRSLKRRSCEMMGRP